MYYLFLLSLACPAKQEGAKGPPMEEEDKSEGEDYPYPLPLRGED
jgi:hypothetical protein